jgi:hypothetical protein
MTGLDIEADKGNWLIGVSAKAEVGADHSLLNPSKCCRQMTTETTSLDCRSWNEPSNMTETAVGVAFGDGRPRASNRNAIRAYAGY